MKKILFTAIFIAPFGLVHAQEYYKKSEYGIGSGIANYYGDLNPDQKLSKIGYSGSAFFKHNFNSYISLKLAGSYAKIGASDKDNSDNTFALQRNLSFGNNIYELALQSEFNFLKYDIQDFENRFTPYISLGVGVFNYNPYAYIGGKKYLLRPLGTEGQNYAQYGGRKYSNTALSLPIGMGFKFWINGGITFGFEIIDRFTSTDYLDDVSTTYVGKDLFNDQTPGPYLLPALQLQDRSNENGGETLGIKGRQRGISSTKDQFITAQATLSIRLKTYKCPGNL